MTPSNELALLLSCARARLGVPGDRALDEHVVGGLDWVQFIRLCRAHSMLTLVRGQLDQRLQHAPASVMRAFAQAEIEPVARTALLSQELGRVARVLNDAGVPVLAYKGLALSLQAYGDVRARTFQDLDVLVRPTDFRRARSALLDSCYRTSGAGRAEPHPVMFLSECDETLIHQTSGLVVELHWAVTPPYFGVRYDVDDLLRRSVPLAAGDLTLRAPRPEDTVVLMSINGVKDGWGRLETVMAVAEIVRREPDLDWDLIWRIAAKAGARRMLRIALELVALLFEIPLPAHVRGRSDLDPGAQAIAAQVRDRLYANPMTAPDWRGRLNFVLRAHDSQARRIGLLLRRALTPTERDVATFPLPTSLWPLYYLLRPIRLLRSRARPEKSAGH